MSTGNAYYNEIDEGAAAWLCELMAAGLIPEGAVDTRSIWDVAPEDLRGFTQHHFFAGIGGWAYALRLAGWPDDRPIWTGSCPCQPFSSAGKGGGFTDERHLWPAWHWLIKQWRPNVVAGEQVEAAIKHDWLDLVQGDLEAEGYAVGFVGLPAASVCAPHLRHRLWFVADAQHPERGAIQFPGADERDGTNDGRTEAHGVVGARSKVRGVADNIIHGLQGCSAQDIRRTGRENEGRAVGCVRGTSISGLGDTHGAGEHPPIQRFSLRWLTENRFEAVGGEPLGGCWSGADWLRCADDKSRPVEPGTFPLAHGVPARVGRLRGYGNAIVPQVAAEVITAYMSLNR